MSCILRVLICCILAIGGCSAPLTSLDVALLEDGSLFGATSPSILDAVNSLNRHVDWTEPGATLQSSADGRSALWSDIADEDTAMVLSPWWSTDAPKRIARRYVRFLSNDWMLGYAGSRADLIPVDTADSPSTYISLPGSPHTATMRGDRIVLAEGAHEAGDMHARMWIGTMRSKEIDWREPLQLPLPMLRIVSLHVSQSYIVISGRAQSKFATLVLDTDGALKDFLPETLVSPMLLPDDRLIITDTNYISARFARVGPQGQLRRDPNTAYLGSLQLAAVSPSGDLAAVVSRDSSPFSGLRKTGHHPIFMTRYPLTTTQTTEMHRVPGIKAWLAAPR